jgi:hypothetical protein
MIDVHAILIGRSDLKNVKEFGRSPPEECGPMSMLESAHGDAAMSKTLVVTHGQISEAVGSFADKEEASSAYRKLNKASRLRCMERAIAFFSRATVQSNRKSIEAGDKATQTRFRVVGAGDRTLGFVDLIAIKLGRCAAALLVGTEGGRPPNELTASTSATAARLLSGSCR